LFGGEEEQKKGDSMLFFVKLTVLFKVGNDDGSGHKQAWVQIQLVVKRCLGKEAIKR
jgi:hypothetical protein